MQLLKFQQQSELRTSRARSFDKERKPIFRKDSKDQPDFAGIEQGFRETKNERRLLEIKDLSCKPPLPSDYSKATLPIDSKSDFSLGQNSSKPRRNPILDDSASIHRWLQ